MSEMCNNCNCDSYDLCSIVGHKPVGFCCSKCELYDEAHTCLKMKNQRKSGTGEVEVEPDDEIQPISSEIENGMLKVVVGKKDEKIPIYIDLKKQFESD